MSDSSSGSGGRQDKSDEVPRSRRERLVDADRFLTFTERLREVHNRVDGARTTPEVRARWQRRLIGISDEAKDDLGQAEVQLELLVTELERRLGGG